MKTSKVIIFQPAYSSSGLQMAGALFCSSGCKVEPRPGQEGPSIVRRITHSPALTHSHEIDLDPPPIHLLRTSLGCGRKSENPEKTHADMGRNLPTPHTAALLRINFFPHKHLNKITLLENLLLLGLKEEHVALNKVMLECALWFPFEKLNISVIFFYYQKYLFTWVI